MSVVINGKFPVQHGHKPPTIARLREEIRDLRETVSNLTVANERLSNVISVMLIERRSDVGETPGTTAWAERELIEYGSDNND